MAADIRPPGLDTNTCSSGGRPARKFAIYDLDRTITRRPTWSRFLLYAAWKHAPWRLLLVPVAAAAALLHLVRLVDRDRLKEIMHRVILGPAIPSTALDALARGFARREAQGGFFPSALAAISSDRATGYHLVIATAAHVFYARAIAEIVGIDDVVGTEATIDGADVLAKMATVNCYGEAKQRRIAAWLADREDAAAPHRIRFYTDHLSDLPTLNWVDEPIVVNPGRPLRGIAEARGWAVVDWR